MGLVSDAWSVAARVRRKLATRRSTDWERTRLAWVEEHARGHSFVDVGGMFKYVGDIAFHAEESGATAVTMVDVGDPDLPIGWDKLELGTFEEKVAARGSMVRYVQVDLEDPAAPAMVGPHDIGFYSGVLYHTPNPYTQLAHLREMVTQRLYLSTLTIPEIPGFPNACVFYPHLDERSRRPYARGYHWAESLLAVGTPVDERPMMGYGNCWWGISRSALRAMLRAARFDVLEELTQPHAPFVTDFVCSPRPGYPMLPPVEYFRWRGEAAERGEAKLPFETWYEEQDSKQV